MAEHVLSQRALFTLIPSLHFRPDFRLGKHHLGQAIRFAVRHNGNLGIASEDINGLDCSETNMLGKLLDGLIERFLVVTGDGVEVCWW